jgi:hypothetical protein
MTIPDSWQLQWHPSNPGEIPAGGRAGLQVTGGFAPYQWQVSGQGFHFERNNTAGRANTLYAAPDACGTAAITVLDHQRQTVGGSVRLEGFDFSWDPQNPAEFPEGDPAVTVSVTGGRPPYQWEISEGFRLGCTSGCGPNNRVSVAEVDTACVARIIVRDSCDSTVEGAVRRQGYWRRCFRYKGTACYVSKQCGASPELDFGRHRVVVKCCRHGLAAITGVCDVDNWEFSAVGGDCSLDNDCAVPQVWALYIWFWVCY